MGGMPKRRRSASDLPPEDALFAVKQRKKVPHEFVLEALAPLSPRTNPMFGCLAVYVGEKIAVILRDKSSKTEDNGVWLATTEEHHESLRREFPKQEYADRVEALRRRYNVLALHAWQFVESYSPNS